MYNFIVICIDCLRFDSFKKKYEEGLFLNNIINKHGFSFEKAYTTSPWTYPSTNSILTGLYPHKHGAYQEAIYKERVTKPWPSKLNSKIPTIFSELKKYGYYNLGISTIFWTLNENCDYSGCDKIIRTEEQNVFYKNTKAEWVVDTFINAHNSEIKTNQFFAYLHLIDLHRPYDLDLALKHSTEPIEIMDGIDEWDIRPYLNDPENETKFKNNKIKIYNALINYLDTQIQRLIEFLTARKIFDNTFIIITADHGEEFWDHLEFEQQHYSCGKKSNDEWWLLGTGHGHTLFNELIHVPLIIINPDLAVDNKVAKSPVSIVDIYPTIMDILGVEPGMELDGKSLLKYHPQREILVESTLYGFERKAMLRDSLKYIHSPHENHFVRYDLSGDPLELNPFMNPPDDEIRLKLQSLYS